ncbi:MAG: zinc ribbon domain-containing protein [Sulfolobus sp.]
MVIYCKRCGYANPDDAVYCPRCGFPLKMANQPSKNPSRRYFIIGLGAALVALGGGLYSFLIFYKRNQLPL